MQCLDHTYKSYDPQHSLSMLLISEVKIIYKRCNANSALFLQLEDILFCTNSLQGHNQWLFFIVLPFPIDWFICIDKIHDIKQNYISLIAPNFHLQSDITLTSGAKSKQTGVSVGQLCRVNKCNCMDPGNYRDCLFLPAPAGCSMSSHPWMGIKGLIWIGTISNKTGSSISAMGR